MAKVCDAEHKSGGYFNDLFHKEVRGSAKT